MNHKINNLLKAFVPPEIIRVLTGFFYGWHGNYSSWQAAKDKCLGYEASEIIDKVKSSLLKVKEGSAVYERDSLLFSEIQYSFPLLSALMWIAAKKNGRLNVLDFGGSLGSTYFQNRFFLNSLSEVNWCIVEQKEFVITGIESFGNKKLHFFYSIEECMKSNKIDVILLSSVLQYIEEPYKLIDQIKSSGIDYLLIDRTPFITGKDRITIQKVNPRIYKGSYPCWFFNKAKFLSSFSADYKLILEFDALDKSNISSEFKGFIFERRE